MASLAPKRARLWHSLAELTRLRNDVAAWQDVRTGPDRLGSPYQGQFDSQLAAVLNEVNGAIAEVETALKLDVGKSSTGELYARLTRCDRQLVWIRRAWDFFRAKFDQRDSVPLLRTLCAADEVLWSCYKLLFQKLGRARPPAPLPYIELDYLPSAVLASQGHLIDREDAPTGGPLGDYFTTLPIPVLRLPPAAVTAPWVMALVAHELGHFVLPYLATDQTSLLASCRQTMAKAVTAEGGTDADRQRWNLWAPEVFADWFAVVNVGGAVAWSIAQYELTIDSRMRTARTFYPSPEVRLLLVAEIARAHGLTVFGNGVAANSDETLDHRVARRVALATTGSLDGFGATLAQLASFRRQEHEDEGPNEAFVTQWARALCDGSPGQPPKNIRHPRLLAAAAARACCVTSDIEDSTAQDEQNARIGRLAFDWIAACSELETRTAPGFEPPAPAGRDLKSRLMEATDEELMGGGAR